MRKRSFRLAVTAAVFCMSAFLLACPMGQLRLLIPDFFTSDVKGVQLYRIDDASGQLVEAGHIEFLGSRQKQDVEQLKYRQFTPEGDPWFGPGLHAGRSATRASRTASRSTLAFLNQLPAGWFKVASYNLFGTSRASAARPSSAGAEG